MQTSLVEEVIATLRTSAQLLSLVERIASVLYSVDASRSDELRSRVAIWRFTFGDLSCIEYTYGHLPANPTLQQVTDLIFRAYPDIAKEIRVAITKAAGPKKISPIASRDSQRRLTSR